MYKARSSTNEVVAVKLLSYQEDGENLLNITSEISILRTLRSPYIVSFYDSYYYNDNLWIIMECCEGGSLSDLIEITTFQEDEIKGIMAYCILGLRYLHSLNYIHRDIKSGNILLTANGKAKLSDFGVTAQLSSSILSRKTVIGRWQVYYYLLPCYSSVLFSCFLCYFYCFICSEQFIHDYSFILYYYTFILFLYFLHYFSVF